MSRRATIVAAVLAAALIGVWMAGYWPEHQRRNAIADELARVQSRLQSAEARSRGAELLGLLLTVEDAATAQNYGLARDYATRFFDTARAEPPSSIAPLREAVDTIVASRDAVTAALTMADPGVTMTLKRMERRLRTALGYPMPVTA
jgi:hypothetical protein